MTPADRPDPAGPRTAEVGEASGPDGPVEPVDTVELTPTAGELLRKLHAAHGPLMFHQSGGCCDGSAPMCYPAGEFRTGRSDVLLASLAVAGVEEPVPFWMSTSQYELWRHTRLIVDVVEGRGSGFSLEAPEGVRFLIRSRLI
ncbi:UDP-glucose 4-epimerase [Streptomyces xanthochromogenes]